MKFLAIFVVVVLCLILIGPVMHAIFKYAGTMIVLGFFALCLMLNSGRRS